MNLRVRRALTALVSITVIIGTTPALAVSGDSGRERTLDDRAASGRNVIVLFAEETVSRDAFGAMAVLGASSSDVELRPHGLVIAETPAHLSPAAFAAELDARPDVVVAAPDFELHALGIPDDAAYPDSVVYVGKPHPGQRTYLGPVSEHPQAVNLEPLWEIAFGEGEYSLAPDRTGVTVAVIDTGVTPPLREETGEYVMVWDYANRDPDPYDDHSIRHGTRVASIIRSQTDNAFGIAGVLGRSRNPVLVYKTLSASGSGSVAWTAEAMLDASARGAHVINLSLGISPTSAALTASQRALLDAVVETCRSNGSLVIAAAGNAGTQGVFYPAASPGAIAVGAIEHVGDSAGERWASSSYGPELDLVAPGTGIWGVSPADTTSPRSGTSYATPIVSGTVALLWSLMPGLTDTEIESLVLASADGSIGPSPGFDIETGNGRLDAHAAFESLLLHTSSMTALEADAFSLGGFEYELAWSAPTGASDVYYRYGTEGGPTYETTDTSARLFVTEDGDRDLWVRAYASNRWRAASATTVTVNVATGLPSLRSERHAGRDRYDTAARVARAAYPHKVDTVVLASGADWPDALTAGPLAHALGAPVLTTRTGTLPVDIRNELLRLDPSTVMIVGGAAAVSTGVEDVVRALLPAADLVRVAGADRYETAAHVADLVATTTGLPGRRAFVASGRTWPDALAASPAAAASGAPILLVRRNDVPRATRDVLASLGVKKTVVVGGSAVVSEVVASSLPMPTRVSGRDRYATSREIASWSKEQGILTDSGLGVTSGETFADALIASPLLASRLQPLLLGDRINSEGQAWLTRRDASSLTIFGGPVAVGIEAENTLKRILRGPRP